MEALLDYVIKSLVDHPDQVQIQSAQTDEGVQITVSVDARDAGIVIGKRGYVVKAIRQLLRVISYRERQKVFLDVVPVDPAVA
jgi:predicted RNA-binding protein YlqC (UPF0109 family)